MKTIFSLLTLLFLTLSLSAQDIKFSKKVAYIDDVPFLKWEENLKNRVLTPMMAAQKDEPIFTLHIQETSYYNDAAKKYVPKPYFSIRFLDFDGECEMSGTLKKLVKKIYKSGMLDAEGNLDEEKAKKFIRTYGEEIEKPVNVRVGY